MGKFSSAGNDDVTIWWLSLPSTKLLIYFLMGSATLPLYNSERNTNYFMRWTYSYCRPDMIILCGNDNNNWMDVYYFIITSIISCFIHSPQTQRIRFELLAGGSNFINEIITKQKFEQIKMKINASIVDCSRSPWMTKGIILIDRIWLLSLLLKI